MMEWKDNFDYEQRTENFRQQKTEQEYTLERAAKFLARRAYTRQGLYQKLVQDGLTPETVLEALDRMDDMGVLDDEEYGRNLIRKCIRKGYGPIRIAAELHRSGVDGEIRQIMLQELPDEMDMLLVYLNHVCVPEDLEDEKYYQKLSRSLNRKGYHWSVINEGMRRYQRMGNEI